MSKSGDDGDGYEVGYGKPPREHRYKPGRSGNPSGRPFRVPNTMDDAVRRVANRIVRVKDGDRFREETLGVMVIETTFREAAKGDPQAIKLALELLKRPGALGERDMTHDELVQTLTPEEIQAIEEIRDDLGKYLT